VFNLKKMKYVLTIIIGFMFYGCEKSQELGIEIYQVKQLYPDFTKQPKPECFYCFEPKKSELYDKPIITESDIEKFDWKNQKIILTEEGKQKISELEIPLEGLAVAMVLNGKPIYGFWFWNIASSFGCDRVYTYPQLGFEIKFGLPNDNTFGNDPRFDSELKQHLNKRNET